MPKISVAFLNCQSLFSANACRRAPASDFLAVLKRNQAQTKALPGLDILREFCSAVKQFVGGPVDCEPVPSGTDVMFGQEYKVVISYYPANYSGNLLRAYLNQQGAPYLDVYDKRGPQPCGDLNGLRTQLSNFLSVPGVADMLESFRRDAEIRH
jgi:hypothetical protein